MKLKAVRSSNLRGVGYDPATFVLEVEFRNGSRWRYAAVTAKTADVLMSAQSPGSVFAQTVKGKFESERIVRRVLPKAKKQRG